MTQSSVCKFYLFFTQLLALMLILFLSAMYLLLSPFHNLSHSGISHIHINVDESMRNAKMTYIVKRRKYLIIVTVLSMMLQINVVF